MAKAVSVVAGMKYLGGSAGINEVLAKVGDALEKLGDAPVVVEVHRLVGWM